MPAYITVEDVKLRLKNKVRFEDDEGGSEGGEQVDKFPIALARRLIDEAEGQVEMDLSPRYAAPFAHVTTCKFKDLPDRPTKNIIRTLCELKSCIRILEDDFGAGSAIDAAKYVERLEKRYRSIIDDDLVAKPSADLESSRQWKNPPLPDLKKNWFNTEADDGYAGTVYVTSSGDGGYPQDQINDPSETFINADLFQNEN